MNGAQGQQGRRDNLPCALNPSLNSLRLVYHNVGRFVYTMNVINSVEWSEWVSGQRLPCPFQRTRLSISTKATQPQTSAGSANEKVLPSLGSPLKNSSLC